MAVRFLQPLFLFGIVLLTFRVRFTLLKQGILILLPVSLLLFFQKIRKIHSTVRTL